MLPLYRAVLTTPPATASPMPTLPSWENSLFSPACAIVFEHKTYAINGNPALGGVCRATTLFLSSPGMLAAGWWLKQFFWWVVCKCLSGILSTCLDNLVGSKIWPKFGNDFEKKIETPVYITASSHSRGYDIQCACVLLEIRKISISCCLFDKNHKNKEINVIQKIYKYRTAFLFMFL